MFTPVQRWPQDHATHRAAAGRLAYAQAIPCDSYRQSEETGWKASLLIGVIRKRLVYFPLLMRLAPWHDAQHAHHFVVFVGKDVTVPDVAAGFVKVGLDPRALFRKNGDHVFWRAFEVPISRP